MKSPLETKNLGERMAKEILKSSLPRAVVIGLIGDLGGGKTTFLQGFAKGIGIKEKILSPTFVIMRKFQIPLFDFTQGRNLKSQTNKIQAKIGRVASGLDPKFQITKFKTFYHFDCYRIEKEKEMRDLGFKEMIFNPENIICIEWANRIKKILPANTLFLTFEFIDEKTRKIVLGSCKIKD